MGNYHQESQQRQEVVAVCRLLYERHLIVATDGNVSVRLPGGQVLTTPTGRNKGLLQAADLVLTDMQGRKLGGGPEPSSEIRLHLAIYQARPDVQAVVHAHPPVATAFSIAGVELNPCLLPEVIVTLGTIPITRYATPSSEEGPAAIRELIGRHDAMILDHHGAVTVGRTLEEAYNRMETVEHTARIELAARQLGGARALTDQQVAALTGFREAMGLSAVQIRCQGSGVRDQDEERGLETLIESIARQIL